jgi:dimethylaniline monooxygenase (N-oxide forming)
MKTKRLAIIGAGSSGLIALKQALDRLPDWEIACFDKGMSTTGCWGNPYAGFVSTSTKYTTQFACFKKWDCRADPADRPQKGDFFHGDEYGRYLNEFADHFNLREHIHLGSNVRKIRQVANGWSLEIDDGSVREECFDKLIICTSLVAKAKAIETEIPILRSIDNPPKNSAVLVLGGGESAADVAHRLASPLLNNRVFLSLKNGIRVSPRYHPVRGVPSDFLRNRLMLSIHRELRNTIGQKFVEARIHHQKKFERLFPNKSVNPELSDEVTERRTFWDAKLTAKAKGELFNVFHTKSDDFLDDVGAGRITIIGPPSGSSYDTCMDFDDDKSIEVNPDFICPMIGFTSGLKDLSCGKITVEDFYEGCIHVEHDDLFLIGFARPIIGNIPTISEMQAKYVTRLIAGECSRPKKIKTLHASAKMRIDRDFGALNTAAIYPVEMFPYCDRLAREMGTLPTLRKTGSIRAWAKIMRAPASTTHYIDEDYNPQATSSEFVHSPPLITFLLVLIKAFERPLRWLLNASKRG